MTTSRAGGLRKAPKRGRGDLFLWETAKQLLASKLVAGRPNDWLPFVQRSAVVGLTAFQVLPYVNFDPRRRKRKPSPAAVAYRHITAITQCQLLSDSRRERQSLMSSHQQSWWLTDRVSQKATTAGISLSCQFKLDKVVSKISC